MEKMFLKQSWNKFVRFIIFLILMVNIKKKILSTASFVIDKKQTHAI